MANISVDGNSIVIDDCTITINNAFDASTGMATITITPKGGLGTLPALMAGEPGLPPVLQMGSVTTLTAGASATGTLTPLSPGGPGQASAYVLAFGIPRGANGESGSLLDLIEGGIEALFEGALLIWDAVASLFVPVHPSSAKTPTPVYNYPSVNVSTSGDEAGPRTIAQVSIPAQTFAWVPVVSGQTVVTGTTNTVVNLNAYIGSTSGNQIGAGFGVSNQAHQTVVLSSSMPPGSTGTYGQVAANTSATILFTATQVASTTDSWSTAANTTAFSVTAQPIQTS